MLKRKIQRPAMDPIQSARTMGRVELGLEPSTVLF